MPGQCGYIRNVGDAHMAANELTVAYKHTGRPLIEIHGDLVRLMVLVQKGVSAH